METLSCLVGLYLGALSNDRAHETTLSSSFREKALRLPERYICRAPPTRIPVLWTPRNRCSPPGGVHQPLVGDLDLTQRPPLMARLPTREAVGGPAPRPWRRFLIVLARWRLVTVPRVLPKPGLQLATRARSCWITSACWATSARSAAFSATNSSRDGEPAE